MRVLIIGSGGREHALSWKVARSGKAEKIYCAPGNGGTAQEGENIPLKDSDVAGLVSFAKGNVIDFVIPGPELPLTLGVVDAMTQAGIRCFGPSQWCAQLEGSKAFAKDIMQKAGVPTAACGVFTELEAAKSFVEEKGAPIVIKADGLAAGKGVVVAQTKEEALEALDQIMGGVFGAAGSRVVIEEFLVGEEVSLLAFCDGKTALPLPSAQDHKAVFDGDTGPNTGGMGAYSPAPIVPDAELEKMADIAIRPILAEMARQGHPFTGILYAGLMMTKDGPKVLEYNVRFGDPECEPLLMRLESDLLEIMLATYHEALADMEIRWSDKSAACVILASGGYPVKYQTGYEIHGLDADGQCEGAVVYHAGTKQSDGKYLTAGGRVLGVTCTGDTLELALEAAYKAVKNISFTDMHYRHDIGKKALSPEKF